MKKSILLFAFFLLAKLGTAQYSLMFCEDVTTDGQPKMISNSFEVDRSGGLLTLLVKTEDKFNTDALVYRIFYMTSSGQEEEISMFSQKVEPGWNYAWSETVFYDPGTYRVKVYTSKGPYLTSANLSIK